MKQTVLPSEDMLTRERQRQEILALRDQRRRSNLRTLVWAGLVVAYYLADQLPRLVQALTHAL